MGSGRVLQSYCSGRNQIKSVSETETCPLDIGGSQILHIGLSRITDIFPNTATANSDFSVLKREKNTGVTDVEDLSLKGTLQFKSKLSLPRCLWMVKVVLLAFKSCGMMYVH